MSKKGRKKNENSKSGVAILAMAWALKPFFSQGIYVFILFFAWMCYSYTEAYKLGLSWPRIDVYWQNFIVLVTMSGRKVNLHFTKRCTKNKDINSVWQQKLPWMRGVDVMAPINITRSDTMTRIPLLLSEWLKFVRKQARLRILEKIIFGGRNYITAKKL